MEASSIRHEREHSTPALMSGQTAPGSIGRVGAVPAAKPYSNPSGGSEGSELGEMLRGMG